MTIEELEARLETVNVDRDDLKQRLLDMVLQRNDVRDKLDICGLDLVTAKRERDEARAELAFILAEYANERNKELTEDALCLKIAGLTHQRDEARAEVERLTDERDELLVRVEDQGAELRATREAYRDAYRRLCAPMWEEP